MDSRTLASLLVEFAWETLEGIDDSERDDHMLDAFSEALCGLMVSYKIMNPTVNELTFVDSFCEEFRDNFESKFGAMLLLSSENYVN